jgi:hypothetical protein
MTEVTAGQIKGLFYHLVRRVGGVEAAGAFLGVSHQRVSTLQNVNQPDMPTLLQVAILERAIGQSVVFAALARYATGAPDASDCAVTEACEVTEASARLLHLVRTAAPQREIEAAALAVQREAQDVPHAVRKAANG